jgi:hypothetical protein
MTRPRLALLGFAIAMVAVHALAAWWQPLLGEDWLHLRWDVRGSGSWLATHFMPSDMVAYVLAHGALPLAIVSPLATVAIVVGVFVLAHRRLPRIDAWDDVLALIVISGLIWICQPRPGYLWFARQNVASHVLGCAAAVWLIAPFRCGWRVGRGATCALVVAALIVGASTRQIAMATLVGLAIAVRRSPVRPRWMLWTLGALTVATIAGFFDPPHIAILRVLRRGLEPNLPGLSAPIREGGQLVSLVLLLVLAKLAIDAMRTRSQAPLPPAAAAPLPDPRETLSWAWAWLGICVVSLFGPRFGDPTLLPATLVLVVAALPYVQWLCATPALRVLIVGTALGIHAVAWYGAVSETARIHDEFRARLATLERTPAGEVAVIPPYSELRPTPWFGGEDWSVASRQLIGIELFGVRDIELRPWFRWLEVNVHLTFRLESQGLDAAQLRAAVPTLWATDVPSARQQFDLFVKRAERIAGKAFTARLLVDDLVFLERKARPLMIAWFEHGKPTVPRTTRIGPDPTFRHKVTLTRGIAEAHRESYVVQDGRATPIVTDSNAYLLQPQVAGLYSVVVCDPGRCVLLDSFRPRF